MCWGVVHSCHGIRRHVATARSALFTRRPGWGYVSRDEAEMKIVQVLFSGLGGHGSVAFSLVRGDESSTHDHAMLFYGIEPLAGGYADLCGELGIEYAVVLKRPGLDLGSWRDVIDVLRRMQADVVVMHSMALIPAGLAFARTARVPLIAVDHMSNQVKKPKEWVFTALALAAADRTVVLTPAFAAELAERLRPVFRRERVVVIGNGIDLSALSEAAERSHRNGSTSSCLRVGMHSRFSPSKDHETLVRAVAKVDDVRLVLAGAGETLALVESLARDLGLTDRVEFLGMLPESALPTYLGSLDVYVQSSLGETMSTSVMQAMATGLPVLASDVRGLYTMVRSGVTGELFPCGDVDALARLLRRFRDDPAERARMGHAGLAHARAHWSQEAMFRSYDAEFSKLVPRPRGAQGKR